MNWHRHAVLLLSLLLLAAILPVMNGCNKARTAYQQGQAYLHASEFGPALEKFEASLAEDPESNMALFGKACCLFELGRFEEALPDFEQFLAQTNAVRATYKDERFDAEFYRDKCKLELGLEVPQNEDAIPEERMRY